MSGRAVTSRWVAGGIHLLASACIAATVTALVLWRWYPGEYRQLSGGTHLLWIVIFVDVTIGPLLTLLVYDVRKPMRLIRMDLAIIVGLQAAALAYGVWTAFHARPVYLVFEYDRFRVVHGSDVAIEEFEGPLDSSVSKRLPVAGPQMLAARDFVDAGEQADATAAALRGVHIAARPSFWTSYESSRVRVLQAARPVQELQTRRPDLMPVLEEALRAQRVEGGAHRQGLRYLPVVGRNRFWTALLDGRTAEVVALVPLDSF